MKDAFDENLHSTIFILKPKPFDLFYTSKLHLHSTIFILKPPTFTATLPSNKIYILLYLY